jgi:hypothetical protein
MWYAGKPIGFGAGEVIGVAWRYIVASLLAGLVCGVFISRQAWLSGASGSGGAALRIVVISISFTLLYLLTIVLLYFSLSPLEKMRDLLREMVSARSAERPSAADSPSSVGQREQIPTLAK